jgi:hypothetical protein
MHWENNVKQSIMYMKSEFLVDKSGDFSLPVPACLF